MSIIGRLKLGASNIKKTYSDYQAKAPERRAASMDKLRQETSMYEAKARLERARHSYEKARSSGIKSSGLGLGGMSSGLGLTGGMGGMFGQPAPQRKAPVRHHRKHKATASRSRGRTISIRL